MAAFQIETEGGRNYFLHEKQQKKPDGDVIRMFFFSEVEREGALEEVPEGYSVVVNEAAGVPFLKRKEDE